MEKSSEAGIEVPSEEITITLTPSCDQAKLCDNLSVYMDISGQLRTKRKEIYEADRRGALNDQQALKMSVEVAKLKRLSDKMRLLVCEQLRAFISEIHDHLDTTTSRQTVDSNSSAPDGTEKKGPYSLELAGKCTELLHSITIVAMKEEILEKERLLSNVRLHNGKSSAYVMLRSRWRVRPRSCHKDNGTMNAESKQQLSLSNKHFDGVRVKLLQLIKFHDTIGYAMNDVRIKQKERAVEHPRDPEVDQLEADQRLVCFLRLTAAANKDPAQEGQQSSVSYLLAKQVLEGAQHSNAIAEEFKAQCAYLRALSRKQHDQIQAPRDEVPWFFNLIVVAAIWYLFFR